MRVRLLVSGPKRSITGPIGRRTVESGKCLIIRGDNSFNVRRRSFEQSLIGLLQLDACRLMMRRFVSVISLSIVSRSYNCLASVKCRRDSDSGIPRVLVGSPPLLWIQPYKEDLSRAPSNRKFDWPRLKAAARRNNKVRIKVAWRRTMIFLFIFCVSVR